MRKKLVCILFCLCIFGLAKPASAVEKEAGEAAKLASGAANQQVKQRVEDQRIVKLRTYLKKYNSPLVDFADEFVQHADKNELDWKFVAAIAGLESTYGKRIPAGSFNAWGWGIFTGKSSGIGFKDWPDGIATVSEGIKKNYIDDGLITIEAIGGRYAASPTWASRVRFIMNQVEAVEIQTTKEDIALSL